jgi:hypothetical protein
LLPRSERAALAHVLIVSLGDGAEDDPVEEVALAWEKEIQSRLDAKRLGDSATIPSSEVFAKARVLLATPPPDQRVAPHADPQ